MKKYFRLFHISSLLFIVVLSTSFGRNMGFNSNEPNTNEPSLQIQDTFKDSLAFWQEKVVLHTANQHVNNGESIFFKGYLLTGSQRNKSGYSTVLHLELLNESGEIIKTQVHRIIDGMAKGHMVLPKTIAPGSYHLHAYTRWMRNYGKAFFAHQKILVGNPMDSVNETGNFPDALILPEGETLLNGHDNRLVVKILNFKATKSQAKGKVVDNKNRTIATINFYPTGIGIVSYKPKKNRFYHLELEDGSTYRIPKAENQGYLLHVNNIDADIARIQVTASSEMLVNNIKLIGTSGGVRYFESQLNFAGDNIVDIKLAKKDIPKGIFTLQLIDDMGTQLARRPIWIDGEYLNIDIKPVSSDHGENMFKIKVTDLNNLPIQTQLALSVDRPTVGSETSIKEERDHLPDLFTYPTLEKGNNTSKNRKNRFEHDLNILASSFSNKNSSMVESKSEHGIKFPIQTGLELHGYAYDLDNNLLNNANIQVLAQSRDQIWFGETKTNANGLLKLKEIEINGNAKMVFRTDGEDTKTRLVKVKPLQEWEQEEYGRFSSTKNYRKQDSNKEVARLESTESIPTEPVDNSRLIELDEVDVVEKRSKNRKLRPSVYGINLPEKRIIYRDPKNPKSLAQMLSEIPRVTVSGMGNLYPTVSIIGGSGPILWVLDGFPLPQPNHGPGLGRTASNSIFDVMDLVSAQDIERIELMIGADASIFGSRGAGGVILIYTRTGEESEFVSRKEGQLIFQGYEPNLDFESYYQNLSKKRKEKASLLYWNPNLQTDKNGEAIISFKSPSYDSTIRIEASAITKDGKIGFKSIISSMTP